jgi:YggT family protein
VSLPDDLGQGRHGEVGSTEEDDAEWHQPGIARRPASGKAGRTTRGGRSDREDARTTRVAGGATRGYITRTLEPSGGAIIMLELLGFVSYVLQLYVYVLIAAAVLSWLIAFNVVNMRNQFVAGLARLLYALTEPVLRPIRNLLPNLGGIDISPVVVILIIIFIQSVILPNIARALL